MSDEQLEALRWMLMKAIEAYSEEIWCAGWYSGIEKVLHQQCGRWETVGRITGWPIGGYEDWTWVTWDEAAAEFDSYAGLDKP